MKTFAFTLALAATVWCSWIETAGAAEIVYWSWYHDDDLRSPQVHKVAFLATRLYVDRGTIKETPRLNRLRTSAARMAVVRIDVRSLPQASERDFLVSELTRRIITATVKGRGKLSGVQIDYDARLDEREFYIALLKSLRSALPKNLPLSMTALASWCTTDRWLSRAKPPVDEVVPMLFTMGAGRQSTLRYIARHPLDSKFEKLSLGISVDDTLPLELLSSRGNFTQERVYVFSRGGWNGARVDKINKLIAEKQKQ